MTKTEARKRAAAALAWGHYHATGSPDYAAHCPACRQRLTTQLNYRWRPAPKGKPGSVDPDVLGGRPARYEQETPRQALMRILADHLTEECQP
jgi:hypothetical protein